MRSATVRVQMYQEEKKVNFLLQTESIEPEFYIATLIEWKVQKTRVFGIVYLK